MLALSSAEPCRVELMIEQFRMTHRHIRWELRETEHLAMKPL